LGDVLIIEEAGTTDFASILLRSFASHGIIQSRLEDSLVIAIGVHDQWGKELPGEYKDKKTNAAERRQQEQDKLSVENLATAATSTPGVRQDMKIAWRYARNAPPSTVPIQHATTNNLKYSIDLDFTSRLVPPANRNELNIGPQATTFARILEYLEEMVNKAVARDAVVRIVIPSLLHPSIYGPAMARSTEIIPFVYGIRGLCRRNPMNVCAAISIPLELYPRDGPIVRWIEELSDGVIHLEAFPEGYISNQSKDDKQYQGFLHIHKVPFTSERGSVESRVGEYAFRVGRRKFEVHDWGIPVEDGPDDTQNNNSVDF
jgi:elongator complex protein 4